MNTSITTTTVRTQQNDTLYTLCWRQYGEKMLGSPIVEQVLTLNHGLADRGPVLPLGLSITLPIITTTATTKETVQLWT